MDLGHKMVINMLRAVCGITCVHVVDTGEGPEWLLRFLDTTTIAHVRDMWELGVEHSAWGNVSNDVLLSMLREM